MILNSVFPFSHLLPKHTAIRPPSQPLVAQVNEELFKSQPQRFRRRDEELGECEKTPRVIVYPRYFKQAT